MQNLKKKTLKGPQNNYIFFCL